MSVRAYRKLDEIAATGKGGYLLAIFGEAGLRSGEVVTRVEGQVRRRSLRSMHIETPEDLIGGGAGQVWKYVTGKWLRWVDAGSATRKTRADTDPRWVVVQQAQIGHVPNGTRQRSTSSRRCGTDY